MSGIWYERRIAAHYFDIHQAEKSKVHEIVQKFNIEVPSFDKPMLEALRIGRGHDRYPPLFLFRNYKQAGVPRHVFEAVRKSDSVLEKYFKNKVQEFIDHLSAASGDKSCSQYSKVYCSLRNKAVRALKRARNVSIDNTSASNDKLKGIDKGLYCKDGRIRHQFEDLYNKANVGIPRLDLITLK